ncbi:MAG: hypothetical protein MZU95_13700 [Desulfomicrobium escambiense]|nr:hypothetical protein [Desulfomicrobium escambiense]
MGDQDHHRATTCSPTCEAFSPAVRDIFEQFDIPHPDRPPRQGGPAVPGHREVRQHRPAPGPRSATARWGSCSRS